MKNLVLALLVAPIVALSSAVFADDGNELPADVEADTPISSFIDPDTGENVTAYDANDDGRADYEVASNHSESAYYFDSDSSGCNSALF